MKQSNSIQSIQSTVEEVFFQALVKLPLCGSQLFFFYFQTPSVLTDIRAMECSSLFLIVVTVVMDLVVCAVHHAQPVCVFGGKSLSGVSADDKDTDYISSPNTCRRMNTDKHFSLHRLRLCLLHTQDKNK